MSTEGLPQDARARDVRNETSRLSFLREVLESRKSDFYRNRIPYPGTASETLPWEQVPLLTRDELSRTSLDERLYSDSQIFVKIVHGVGGPMLIARSPSELGKEPWGPTGVRPLVALSSLYENVEKSLWVYEQNILPLIYLDDVTITALAAERYEIDSIVADEHTLTELAAVLSKECREGIQHVSVIGRGERSLAKLSFPNARAYEIFSLPETGGIAERCSKNIFPSVWHTFPDSFVETIDDELVVTRIAPLPTPIIRYRTDIQTQEVEAQCPCGDGKQTLIIETGP